MRGRRYFDKMEHKRRMKKAHAMQYDNRENPRLLEQELRQTADDPYSRRHAERNGGYHYWDRYYLSSARGFAKRFTNKRIRQTFRERIRNDDPENVVALQGSEYEKEFDYAWTIW